MITIRLKKNRAKNKLSYLIVVCFTEKSPASNDFIEKIGFYKPLVDSWDNKYVYVDLDRMSFWLKRGAKLNISVYVLLKNLILQTFNE